MRRISGALIVALVAVAVALGIGSRGAPVTGPSTAAAAGPTAAGGADNAWPLYPIGSDVAPENLTDILATPAGFVGIVWRPGPDAGGSTTLVESAYGAEWKTVAPPAAGFVASTGTVVDGELHVIGYTGSFDAPVWWHFATRDLRAWRTIGQMSGFPRSTFALELGYAPAGWLARVAVHGSSTDGAATRSELRFSTDGISWVPPSVPQRAGALFYGGVATDGRGLLVLRSDESGERTQTEALSSADGATWTSHVVSDVIGGPASVAFDRARYVAVGQVVQSPGSNKADPAAWWSEDGFIWQSAQMDFPAGQSSRAINLVLDTAVGFVAIGELDGDVWVSSDGRTWTAHLALPAGQRWSPLSGAADGSNMLVGDHLPDGRAGVRVGSLSQLVSP